MKINKIKQLLPALLSMGMTFIVLGVLMLAASFVFGIKNNILLFDKATTEVIKARQQSYLADSRQITLDEVVKWPIHRRIWNNALAILGPVL